MKAFIHETRIRVSLLLEGRNRKYPVAIHQAKNRMGQEPKRKEALMSAL